MVNAKYKCGRQSDRHEQSQDDGPGIEGHQDRTPWVPSNGQN